MEELDEIIIAWTKRRDRLKLELSKVEQELAKAEQRLREAIADKEETKSAVADTALKHSSKPRGVQGTRTLPIDAPRISVKDAAFKGMAKLRSFTRNGLAEWIAREYPLLEFSVKTLDRPFSVAKAEGKIRVLKPNIGNTLPAEYEWIASSKPPITRKLVLPPPPISHENNTTGTPQLTAG